MTLGKINREVLEALGRTVLQYKVDAPEGLPVYGAVQGAAANMNDVVLVRSLFLPPKYLFSFTNQPATVSVPAQNGRGYVTGGGAYKFAVRTSTGEPVDVQTFESEFGVSVHRISNDDASAKKALQDAITNMITMYARSIPSRN